MKKIIVAATFMFVASIGAVKAQSFLNNLTSSSTVSSLVSAVTGSDISVSSVVGTWNYSSPAVYLESDNVLKQAAASVATSTLESKLGDLVSSYGITAGTFSFTFNSDSSFSCSLKGQTLSGTYSTGDSKITLKFSAAGTVNIGSVDVSAEVSSSSLSLLFPADKLLELVSAISTTVDSSTLSVVETLIEQYDSVMLGFKLTK